MVGRRIRKSATSAASMAKALSQPKSRSDGRSEKTVTARPQGKHQTGDFGVVRNLLGQSVTAA